MVSIELNKVFAAEFYCIWVFLNLYEWIIKLWNSTNSVNFGQIWNQEFELYDCYKTFPKSKAVHPKPRLVRLLLKFVVKWCTDITSVNLKFHSLSKKNKEGKIIQTEIDNNDYYKKNKTKNSEEMR